MKKMIALQEKYSAINQNHQKSNQPSIQVGTYVVHQKFLEVTN